MVKTVVLKCSLPLKTTAWPVLIHLWHSLLTLPNTFADEEPDHNLLNGYNAFFFVIKGNMGKSWALRNNCFLDQIVECLLLEPSELCFLKKARIFGQKGFWVRFYFFGWWWFYIINDSSGYYDVWYYNSGFFFFP